MRYPARFGAVEDLRQQVRFGKSCRQIRRAPDLGSVWVTVEIARGLRQQAVQPVARMDAGQVGHLGQVVLGHLLQHLGAQKGGTAVVQLGEAMGDAGLQREAAQKRGAEAVDRLHLQPARRFNRLREQAARGGQIGIAPRAQLRQRRAQGRVGQHRPFAKALQQAVLHLAGGGLGIGQAQHPFGPGARQQQPRHPVGQHPRLARSGIGRQPGRASGIGRRDLAQGGGVRGLNHDRPP